MAGNRRAWLLGLALSLLATVPAWLPFLRPDMDLWNLHDGGYHQHRAFFLIQLIKDGNWYPRWVPEEYGGYGYPTFNFYAPAMYYAMIALAAVVPHLGLYGAFQVLGALAALGIVSGAYMIAWGLWRNAAIAFFVAGAVAYSPYLLPVGLYISGGLPQLLGQALTVWLVTECLWLWRRVTEPAPLAATGAGGEASQRTMGYTGWGFWWWTIAGTTTAMLLTHNASAALAVPVMALWLGCLFLWRPSWRALVATATAALTGAALTAFLWIPALLETRLVQVDRMFRGNLNYHNWFMIWPGYSPPLWGLQERSPYTVGTPIDLHLIYPNASYGPTKLGLVQGVLLAGTVLALIIFAIRPLRARTKGGFTLPAGGAARRGTQGPALGASSPPARAFTRPRATAAAPELSRQYVTAISPAGERRLTILTVFFGLTVFLLYYSQSFDWWLPAWERFAALRSVQLPSRFLPAACYGLVLAAGGSAALYLRPRQGWALAVVAVALTAASNLGNRPMPLDAGVSHRMDVNTIIAQERTLPGFTDSTEEFLPRTAGYEVWHEGEARGFWLYERMFPEASWLAGRVRAWQGNVGIHSVAGGLLWTQAEVEVGVGGGTLAVHQLLFSGWRAWVDGHAVPVGVTPENEAQAIQPGFMLVDVPAGRHTVAVRFGPDGPRLAGIGVSLAALLAIGGWLLTRVIRSRRSAVQIEPAPASGHSGMAPLVAGAAALAIGAAVVVMAGRTALQFRAPHSAGSPDALLVQNVVDDVLAGKATVGSPTGSTLGADRFVDVRYLAVQAQDRPLRDAGASTRRWLFTHPPTQVSDDLVIPPDAYFQAGLALDPASWEAPLGDGVRYLLTVTPQGGQPVTLLDAAVNPRADGTQRRWIDVVADLRPWAGQTVRLTLRTDAREDPTYDWAGWSEPSVVRLDPQTAARLMDSTRATKEVALRG